MPVQLTCARPGCGKVFPVSPSMIARGRGRFCSRACTGPARTPLLERFWAGVPATPSALDLDACWLWTGAVNAQGYGTLSVGGRGGRALRAHRLAYTVFWGPIPADSGRLVRHLCEGRYAPGDLTCRRCINPYHLTVGTDKENAVDRLAAGRRSPLARLTDEQAEAVRQRYAAGGVSQQALGEEYGLSQHGISKLVRRRHYADVA